MTDGTQACVQRDTRIRPLVVGLGRPDGGDDAIGPMVARRMTQLGLRGIRVIEREDPTSLIDMWWNHDPVVVIGAVRSGGLPGLLTIFETGCAAHTLIAHALKGLGGTESRTLGLAATIELSRALDRLPRRLVLIGIEAVRNEQCVTISPELAASVPLAVEAVIGAIWETGTPMTRPWAG